MNASRSIAGAARASIVVTAIALTAPPATAQIVENPRPAPVAVQTASDLPLVEVDLIPGSRWALGGSDAWEALAKGMRLIYDGERPVEVSVRAALVASDGELVESRRLDVLVLEKGDASVDGESIVLVEDPETVVPAAVFTEAEAYVPRDGSFPGRGHLPDLEWDRGHGLDTDERGVMPGDNVVRKRPGRTKYDRRAVGIDPGRFLVVTAVPTGDAHEEFEVRPLILDLDARGQTGNPLLAPADKPDW